MDIVHSTTKTRTENVQQGDTEPCPDTLCSVSVSNAPEDNADLAQQIQSDPVLDSSVRAERSGQIVIAKNTDITASQLQGILEGQAVKVTPAPAQGGDGNVASTTGSYAPIAGSTCNSFSSGPFCLYAKHLDTLQKVLIPDATTGTKDYAALFAKIKELQLKKDHTAQCFIRVPTALSNGYGRFKSRLSGFTEPMGDKPYDVGIARLSRNYRLNLPHQVGPAKIGIEGILFLATFTGRATCVSGGFKMVTVPVWTGTQEEALYEGHVRFNVKCGMCAREGDGSRTTSEFGFWAIRSMDNDAFAEGDVAHLIDNVGVGAGVGNPVSGLGCEEEEKARTETLKLFAKRHKYWRDNLSHKVRYPDYDSDEDYS